MAEAVHRRKLYFADLDAMGRVRAAFDETGLFNPCKVLPSGHGCAAAHSSELRAHLAAPGVYI